MTSVGASAAGALRRLAVDLTPLRSQPAYRRLWAGQAVSATGSQVTAVAVPLQVYAITRSPFLVGLTGLVALVPLIGFGLLGGAVADSVDRRRLTLRTSTGLAATSAVLVLQAVAGWHSLGVLYTCLAAQSALSAVDSPARRAMMPRLLPAAQLPAALALSQVVWNLATVLGPLIAGGLIASTGYATAYGLDVVSFAAALWSAWRLPPMPPEGGGTRAGVASVAEGLRFLRSRPVIMMSFVVDVVAMVFGMPRALFPSIATHLGGGAGVAGMLYAAPAAGALLGALSGGWLGRVHRQGLAVLIAVAVWGAAIAGFGVAGEVWLALVLLAVAGAADMVSAVFRNSIMLVATPDDMQGRAGGVFTVVVTGGPRLGDLEAGVAGSLVSPTFSVVSGGLACVAGVAAIAALAPWFARYTAPAART